MALHVDHLYAHALVLVVRSKSMYTPAPIALILDRDL
jgi:hypothetical protein